MTGAERRAFHARFRRDQLATGFDDASLRLAGVTDELVAAEDDLRSAEEARIEAAAARALDDHIEIWGRIGCPPHLYERLYG